MGIGDSIGKAAENAMEDLAGTSKPTGNVDVPDPADPNDDVEVHSSLSEGSNAMEAEKQKAPGLKAGAAPDPVSEAPLGGDVEDGEDGEASGTNATGLTGGASAPSGGTEGVPRDVPGPAGLPDGDPDELRADPSEGDQDPSTSTGRG
ncbi:hypothetical protein ACFVYC_07150 [Pseudarthrobacter sp. NPDC058329]|uniref:hypothetical protein n=1 Tax=Pseudarthrobacter sp. NPDC058329 TaxID=3346448 RepID=UPI0036D7AB1A